MCQTQKAHPPDKICHTVLPLFQFNRLWSLLNWKKCFHFPNIATIKGLTMKIGICLEAAFIPLLNCKPWKR